MKVCLILEGCYPYVRGGVSTWAHEYMKSNPDIEFVVWTVHADRKHAKEALYELPSNVTQMREIFLEDAYFGGKPKKNMEEACNRIVSALSDFFVDGFADWDSVMQACRENMMDSVTLGNSESFFSSAVDVAKGSNGSIGLSDAYYGLKSMLIPLCFLLGQEIPEADIYHSAVTGYGGILGSLARYVTKKPYILTEHGIYPREREEELLQADWVISSLRGTWTTMFYNMSRCAYHYADRVTALFQQAMEKQIEIGCDRQKCRVVSNGIFYEKFENIPFCENEDTINIGAFLRFAPIKDIKTLIFAFYELCQRMPNVCLYLLGGTDDEAYKEECLALIKRLKIDNIRIEGHVDTVAYMQKMHITVMSSISEGQPLAILESLAAARPCVTTNVGNCKGLLEEPTDGYGQAGFCCTPMDSTGLAAALETLCKDKELRKTFGINGRNRIKNGYTHDQMRSQYLEVYSEVG